MTILEQKVKRKGKILMLKIIEIGKFHFQYDVNILPDKLYQ